MNKLIYDDSADVSIRRHERHEIIISCLWCMHTKRHEQLSCLVHERHEKTNQEFRSESVEKHRYSELSS
jgi:hypothetical protein